MMSILFIGCASKPTINYETINKSKKHVKNSRKIKRDQFKDIENIPQFRNLKNNVAPGFLFYLSHPSDDKIKGKFRVSFDGILRLPYNVRVQTKGHTFKSLKKKVIKRYSKFFKRGVKTVTFKLLRREYYVEVRGFVKKSGRFLVKRKESIDKLIDKAGGLNGDLKKDFFSASIKQQNQSYKISLNQYFESSYFGRGFSWTGRDNIFINMQNESEAGMKSVPIVTMLGGVRTPGKSLFKKDANLFYYISKNGGINDNIDMSQSYLIRTVGSKITKIKFDLSDINTIPVVYANDVIVLTADKRTFIDKILDRTGQIASILTSVAVLLIAL